MVNIYYGGEKVNILGGAKGKICLAYILLAAGRLLTEHRFKEGISQVVSLFGHHLSEFNVV